MRKFMQNFLAAWKNPRMRWALLIAVVSDILGFTVALLPPVQWAIDAITAILLLIVLGFRWQLMIALTVEVIPLLQVFPAWTLVVMSMAATTSQQSQEITKS